MTNTDCKQHEKTYGERGPTIGEKLRESTYLKWKICAGQAGIDLAHAAAAESTRDVTAKRQRVLCDGQGNNHGALLP